MKRILIIYFIVTFVCMFLTGQYLSAQPADDETTDETTGIGNIYEASDSLVLLDFNKWAENIANEELSTYPPEDPLREKPQNQLLPSEMDKDLQPKYVVSQKDMQLVNWVVELNDSSNKPINYANSKTKAVTRNKQTESGTEEMTVLGVRIHFPAHAYNCWAKIRPPFEIAAYNEKGRMANMNNGVANNVGMIKWISVETAGRNFKESIAIRLMDENDNVSEYFLGYLFYNGWRILTWENPNYYEKNIYGDLVRLPLYPQRVPMVKVDSFIIYKNETVMGGDFVTYIANVNMDYELARPEDSMGDIDDEEVWGIFREEQIMESEIQRKKIAEYLDLLRHKQALRRENQNPNPTND